MKAAIKWLKEGISRLEGCPRSEEVKGDILSLRQALAFLEAAEEVDDTPGIRNFMMLLWNDYERVFEAGIVRDRAAGRHDKYDKEKSALDKDKKYYHEVMTLLESLPEKEGGE